MTTTTERQRPASAAGKPPRGNRWLPTFHGIGLVANIELKRRRPSTKGYIIFGVVFAAITGLAILGAVSAGQDKNSIPLELILILVLGVGCLIGPSLAATSINGDSGEGVLAPLQMTRLTAGDLAIGKLLANWVVTVLALLATVPLLLFGFSRAGWTVLELLTVLGTILLVVLIVSSIGLAWSSIAARNAASIALTLITIGFLVLGTVVLFFFTQPLVSETVTATNYDYDWDSMTTEQQNDPEFDYTTLPCVEYSYETSIAHTEKTAWMLLINPIVVIGETAPLINPETYKADGRAAPGLFSEIHKGVSGSRMGPMEGVQFDGCTQLDGTQPDDPWQARQLAEYTYPRQPWVGLGVMAALGLGSMIIAIRRLKVPYKKLRAGTRVA